MATAVRGFPGWNEQVFHLGIQRVGSHHPVDQALCQSGASVNEITGEQHFHGALGRHVAHQRHTGRGANRP